MHQFGFQIMVSKNLNVDSRLVSLDAPTYSPNWVLSYRCWIGSKLGFSTIALYTQFGKIKLVLYFNRNIGSDSIKRLYYTQLLHKRLQCVWCNQGCILDDDVPSILSSCWLPSCATRPSLSPCSRVLACQARCPPACCCPVLVHHSSLCSCPPVWFLHPRHYWHHKLLPWFK